MPSTAVYTQYCAWCEKHGLEPLSMKAFGAEMTRIGVGRVRCRGRLHMVARQGDKWRGLE